MTDLSDAPRSELVDGNFPEWVAEAFGASGMGVSGFVLFVLFTGAIGLFNWSEGMTVPAVWVVVMTPVVSAFLPVPIVWRLVGMITVAVAFLFVGLWFYWQRM